MRGFFYLLAIYFFIKGHNKANWIGFCLAALVSFLMALGCKEIAITLPLMLLVFDYYFISAGKGEKIVANFKKFHLPLIVTGIVILLFKFSYALKLSSPDKAERDFLPHIFTSAYALSYYLKKFFLPLSLNIDPDFPLANSILEFKVVVSFFLILGLLIVSKKVYSEIKTISFSILWFFLTLSPHLFIRLKDIAAERWLYLALAGFGFFVAGLLADTVRKEKTSITLPGILVMILVILLFSTGTFTRNNIWRSSITLWSDAVKKSPNKFRPYNNLGEAYAAQGEIDQAMREYKRALELNPMADRAHYNLGNIYRKKGEIDAAITAYNRAIEINSSYAKAYNNLGSIYLNKGDYEKAKELFFKALEIDPDFPQAHNNLGNVYSELGMSKEAIFEYKKAIDINSDYDTPHYNLARELYKSGFYEETLKELEIASKLSNNPKYLKKLQELKKMRGFKK